MDKIQENKERNKEIFRYKREPFVTNYTINYIIDKINKSVTPTMTEDIDAFGYHRIELFRVRLYKTRSKNDVFLSYEGVMGTCGIRDLIVIDRRCNIEKLIKALLNAPVVQEYQPEIIIDPEVIL